MKKLITLILSLAFIIPGYAGDGDTHFTANVGMMAPYTIDATLGYEHPIGFGHAIEGYLEGGNHWQKPICHRFWKGYFWDGGAAYKHRVARFKNGNLRVLGGVDCGMVGQRIFFGIEAGIEYNYVLSNNWVLNIKGRTCVNFLNGDKFRTGIFIGLKIPL